MKAGLAAGYVALTVVLTGLLLVLAGQAADRTGLRRQVFPDIGFRGEPLVDDISGDISLSFLGQDETLPERFFSARWQGYWYLPEGGTVELYGAGDDRLDIWIDGNLLIQRTPPADMQTEGRFVPLDAGFHEIRVDYEQHGGASVLRLGFVPPNDRGTRVLPSHQLFHEAPTLDDVRLVQRAATLRHIVPVLWATPVAIAFLLLPAATSATRRRLRIVLAGVAWVLAVVVFFKNAWVSDDAYIVFRSLEQVFAGNGAVWNPHERVQAFTSPLWFGMLLFPRIISTDVYLNVVVVSFGLWILTVRNLQRLAPNSEAFATGVLLCVASTAIFDYTTSGLENVLGYALITYFLLQLIPLSRYGLHAQAANRALFRLSLAFGLILVTRHDLLLLVLPPAAFAVWSHRRLLSMRNGILLGLVVLLPLVAWTLFSLLYYGFPWPNTAYAKLNTGMDRALLVAQGFRYLQVALLQDLLTPVVIAAGLAISQLSPRHQVYRFVGLGIALNLAYIVWIGGDFMLGRWLSYSCLIAASLCILRLPTIRAHWLGLRGHGASNPSRPPSWPNATALTSAAVVMFAVLYPHTPVNCWRPDYQHNRQLFGIEAARDYHDALNLFGYLFRPARDGVLPDHRWARSGLDFRRSTELVRPHGAIGMRGYMAGTEKVIVDIFGLADPLLARLPAEVPHNWRIGHFQRELPDGYIERVEAAAGDFVAGSAVTAERLEVLSRTYPIAPPELNDLYDRLALVTQTDDLWSTERLKTILLFNLGAYDYLLEY